MTALPRHELLERVSSFPFAETDNGATARLIRKLIAIYPAHITGQKLIDGALYDPFAGNRFATLCFHFLRANEALAPFDLAIHRSGGQPHSTYCIRPL